MYFTKSAKITPSHIVPQCSEDASLMEALIASNTKVQGNGAKSFMGQQNVAYSAVLSKVGSDTTDTTLCLILDSYAVHLALDAGRQGKLLAKHTVLSYYGQVKNELCNKFEEQMPVCERWLKKHSPDWPAQFEASTQQDHDAGTTMHKKISK